MLNTNENTGVRKPRNLFFDQVVGIGLCFYNKVAEINRLLDSIPKGYIDYIFAIDGIYNFVYDYMKSKLRDSEYIPRLSDDGSREMLMRKGEEKGIKVIIDNCATNEYDKRQRYLELCRWFECNYFLIVDSDEYFDPATDWTRFRKEFVDLALAHVSQNVFNVNFVDVYGRISHFPRAWFNPADMTYFKYSHYKFKNWTKSDEMNDVLDSQYASNGLESLVMRHDHNLRGNVDMDVRDAYENYLVKYESLLAKDFEPSCADKIARIAPSKHRDGCICFKCVEYKKIDVNKIFDPRPVALRDKDPYEKFRNTTKNQ